ncbi:MAG TPA: YetF domain-containing protein [Trueperaceae bacterium]|nr:YetF domain-containing protein [Trueperaceae bacterium]
METVARVVIIYLFVLVALRLMGKREFGELSPVELVMLMLIPDIVAPGITREDFSLTTGILAVSTVMMLVLVTSTLTHLSRRAERLAQARPAVLVNQGVLYSEVLNLERVSPDEVLAAARENGVASLGDVEWAILQPDGKIAIVPRER